MTSTAKRASAILAAIFVLIVVVATLARPAGSAESADLTFAREQLRNCQLLLTLPNLTSAERTAANRCVSAQTKLINALTAGTPSPSASVSPSVSPSASPSPSVSPTVSPTPSATPSPSPTPTSGPRACPDFPAMPDASCTGVPPGVSLHACDTTIVLPGIYDSCLFAGGVYIQAANVTITRSRMTGIVRGSNYYDSGRNLRLVDVEIDGGTAIDPNGQAAIGQDGWSCLRCHVHHTGRGASIGSNVEIRDSYFHDFGSVAGAHVSAAGSNGGAHNRIIHNNLDCAIAPGRGGGCSGALVIYGDFAPVDDWIVSNNLFNAISAYCTYAGSTGVASGKPYPHGTNIRYTDNLFGMKYWTNCSQYGPVAAWEWNAGDAWSNNRYTDGRVVSV